MAFIMGELVVFGRGVMTYSGHLSGGSGLWSATE